MILKEQPDALLPQLNGLVLAGGKSRRMGRDKSTLRWHQKEQQYHMADLLQSFCAEVYISCRAEQQPGIDPAYRTLPDAYEDLGPYGALLSAFQKNGGAAWLVVACDLPLLDSTSLSFLVEHRNGAAVATTFQSPHDGLPEPLVTIWKPKSFPVLLSFLEQGRTCPRKALINSDVRMLQPPQPGALMNANTPEEAEQVRDLLARRASGTM